MVDNSAGILFMSSDVTNGLDRHMFVKYDVGPDSGLVLGVSPAHPDSWSSSSAGVLGVK